MLECAIQLARIVPREKSLRKKQYFHDNEARAENAKTQTTAPKSKKHNSQLQLSSALNPKLLKKQKDNNKKLKINYSSHSISLSLQGREKAICYRRRSREGEGKNKGIPLQESLTFYFSWNLFLRHLKH